MKLCTHVDWDKFYGNVKLDFDCINVTYNDSLQLKRILLL